MRLFYRTILLAAVGTLAFANPKVSRDMPTSTSNGLVDVIIQFKGTPTKDQLKQLGPYGQVKKQFVRINAIHMQLPVSQIQTLSTYSWIAYITPNRPTKSSLDITTQTVNATLAWASGWDGSGVGVAVLDSGVASKLDFMTSSGTSSRIVYSESFVAGTDASDQYGHGTHVAGIVGGNGASSTGPNFKRNLKGVAPNANIINLKVLDANGSGNESDVITGIDRAIQLKNTYNIRVLNVSLGHPVYESYTLDPLCQELEAAWKAGIVVVVAAGNYGRSNNMGVQGYGTIASPGNDPYVITVGAMNAHATPFRWDDNIATYSSKGPTAYDHIVKPDLVAPGNNVVSVMAPNCTIASMFPSTLIPNAYYQTVPAPGNSTDYFRLSGTSMATPVVAGTAALMLQKQPTLTPDQVKARLMKTATKVFQLYSSGRDQVHLISYNNQSDIFTVGAGYLDTNAAVNSLDLTSLPALSPAATYDSLSRRTSVLVNLAITWGDAITWGEAIVWGDNVFVNGTAIIWGDAITWGDATSSGFAIIWGDSVTASTAIQAMDADDGDQDPIS